MDSDFLKKLRSYIHESDEYVRPIVAETRDQPAEYPEPKYRYDDNLYESAEEAIERLAEDFLPDLINRLIEERYDY